MTRSRAWSVGLLLAALLLPGCSQSPPAIIPVEGVVTLNGKPLPNALVQFVPMLQGFGAEYIATGTTDDAGRFKLACLGREGACAGENRVTVSDPPTPEEARGQSGEAQKAASRFKAALKNRPIPEQYTIPGLSPLRVTVTAETKNCELKLTR